MTVSVHPARIGPYAASTTPRWETLTWVALATVVAVAEHAFLRNAWYVAAWDHLIGDDLTALTILGDHICLFRRSDGTVAALADACPHRKLPLSMGRRYDDGVECGYHGLVFDGNGACVGAPGNQGRIPRGADVRSYPVVERYGLSWVWMGNPERADPAGIVEIKHYGDPDWGLNTGPAMDFSCDYRYIVDNLLDPSHVAWVHDTSFAQEAARDAPLEVEKRDTGVCVSRWLYGGEVAPFYAKLVEFDGPCDRHQHYEAFYPSTALARALFTPVGTGGPDRPLHDDLFQMDSWNFLTPITEKTTRYHFFQLRNVRPGDEALDRLMNEDVTGAFSEDRQVLEAVQRGMDAAESHINMHIDTGPLRFRHHLETLIAADED